MAGQLSSGVEFAGKYELVERQGVGAQGSVWRALRLIDRREFAIKIIETQDPIEAKRIRRKEERALKLIGANAHIPSYVDSGIDGNDFYVVTRFVHGRNLEDLRRQDGGTVTDEHLRSAAEGSLMALIACDAATIIHRDVKPANLILEEDRNSVALVDFGISSISGGSSYGEAKATVRFMSPEHGGSKASHRSDMFSWGLTMVYLGAGHHAFGHDIADDGDLAINILRIYSKSPAPDLTGVPDWLRPTIERCLSWDVDARPDAADALQRVKQALNPLPPPPTEPSRPTHRLPPAPVSGFAPGALVEAVRANAGSLVVAAIVALLIGKFTGGGLWGFAAGLTAAAATLVIAAKVRRRPTDESLSVADRVRDRWSSLDDSGQNRWHIPSPEAELAAVALCAVALLLRPSSAKVAAVFYTTLLAICAGVVVVLRSRTSITQRAVPASERKRLPWEVVGSALAALPMPLLAYQLRRLGVVNLRWFVGSLPWWAVFWCAMAVAVFAGLGGIAWLSVRVGNTLVVVLPLTCVAATAVAINFSFGWIDYPDRHRVVFHGHHAVLFAWAACGVVVLLSFTPIFKSTAGAVLTMTSATAAMTVGVLWWVGWLNAPDAWIAFHLPRSIIRGTAMLGH